MTAQRMVPRPDDHRFAGVLRIWRANGLKASTIAHYAAWVHVSISTTNRYVSANLAMKRNVLETFWRRSGLTPSSPAPWQPRSHVLKILDAL
jgi:hypothetical protein